MDEMMFKVLILVLSLVLLASVAIVLGEVIAHRKDEDSKRFKKKLIHMRQYEDGWLLMDDPEMNKALQIMHITSDRIEFSDNGINGKFHEIWRW